MILDPECKHMKNSPPPRDLLLCPWSRATRSRLRLLPSLFACGSGFALAACGLRYALTAQALPLQLGLHARGLGFALVARATRSQLGRSSCYALVARAFPCYALAARALHLRLRICPRGTRYALAACLWLVLRASPSRFALCACSSGFALAVRAMRLLLGLCP